MQYYNQDYRLKRASDFMLSDTFINHGGDINDLNVLKNDLINKDWFKALLDFDDYKKTKDRPFKDYENREKWNKMASINIAKAGYFSSDRTIKQYNEDIWHLNNGVYTINDDKGYDYQLIKK